jgi:hypothetical protein
MLQDGEIITHISSSLAITTLDVSDICDLDLVAKFTTLKHLMVADFFDDTLEALLPLTSLVSLSLINGYDLDDIEALDQLPNLQTLTLDDLPSLEMVSFKNKIKLSVTNCRIKYLSM